MCSLSGREFHTTGKSFLLKGRVYAFDRIKASTFVQEYAKISGRKRDKDAMKVVTGLGCHKRSARTTPRQQIEEAFTPGELQQALAQLKAGTKAGPDGIVPDLKHLPSKLSSILLDTLNSS